MQRVFSRAAGPRDKFASCFVDLLIRDITIADILLSSGIPSLSSSVSAAKGQRGSAKRFVLWLLEDEKMLTRSKEEENAEQFLGQFLYFELLSFEPIILVKAKPWGKSSASNKDLKRL